MARYWEGGWCNSYVPVEDGVIHVRAYKTHDGRFVGRSESVFIPWRLICLL